MAQPWHQNEGFQVTFEECLSHEADKTMLFVLHICYFFFIFV